MNETKKILVVEDEAPMREAIVQKLHQAGFWTIEAKTGKEGFDMATTEQPDLILLDIILPVMDGMEVLKKIRGTPGWGKKIPIIMLTNLSADNEIMKGVFKNEPSYYLVKAEWRLEDVVQKVKETLGVANKNSA